MLQMPAPLRLFLISDTFSELNAKQAQYGHTGRNNQENPTHA